jgi:nicotinate phosphoribosyltransferase
LPDAIIVASGDLNEESVGELERNGAPIDLYGVGTELMTSRDAPALGGVYKLVAVDEAGGHRAVRKLSPEKSTYPDVKQIHRRRGPDEKFSGDVLALANEALPGESLLIPVLRAGQLVRPLPGLPEIRERATAQRKALPDAVRRLTDAEAYPVTISAGLLEATEQLTYA